MSYRVGSVETVTRYGWTARCMGRPRTPPDVEWKKKLREAGISLRPTEPSSGFARPHEQRQAAASLLPRSVGASNEWSAVTQYSTVRATSICVNQVNPVALAELLGQVSGRGDGWARRDGPATAVHPICVPGKMPTLIWNNSTASRRSSGVNSAASISLFQLSRMASRGSIVSYPASSSCRI